MVKQVDRMSACLVIVRLYVEAIERAQERSMKPPKQKFSSYQVHGSAYRRKSGCIQLVVAWRIPASLNGSENKVTRFVFDISTV